MPTTTIGVFDSGFGGLTVLRALLPRIPGAHYIYLGDTARLPYGAKSQTTIARYAVESASFLAARGCDLLVIACNTATALALPEIRAAVSIPVIGVIEPGANAALTALTPPPPQICHPERTRNAVKGKSKDPDDAELTSTAASFQPQPLQVLVLATAATVQSHAYRDACAALGLHAIEKACPLLVPLVEEGWTDHPVTRDVLRIYIAEALGTCKPSAVLLGCTHYPLIASAIEQTLRDLGSHATIIDSAEATAQAVAAVVHASHDPVPQAFRLGSHNAPKEVGAGSPGFQPWISPGVTFTCYSTDSIEKFQRLGSHFLGQTIPQVHLLDLGG
jgi:glutamate racemase